MAITTITQENIKAEIAKGITLLYFWAPWCPPCRQFGPVYEKVSEEFPKVTFGKINIDEEPTLAAEYKVRSIPSVVIYAHGEIVYARPGGIVSTDLKKMVSRLLAGKKI